MDNQIILESKTSSKKYKCPYCEERYEKEQLIDHVGKVHEDMIPEGYSSARIVFNTINKKDHGTCVICHRETAWNETVWRYNRFCSDRCKQRAGELAAQNLMKAKGVSRNEMLSDPDFQNKMLQGRSISGTYKFSKGGSADYVGTYELKFLEFADKVMGFHSVDIMSPGPTIPYMYEGKEHFWITDFLIVPFNLVIDVKDGGSNPNNREMISYREKQKAKEDAISKQGIYNYLRLTDNNFGQLMYALAELKLEGMDDKNRPNTKKFIKINEEVEFNNSIEQRTYKTIDEYCGAMAGPVVGPNEHDVYVVPYLMKNTFVPDYGYTDDPSFEHVLVPGGNKTISPKDLKFFENECVEYEVYKYTGERKPVYGFTPRNLAEAVCGKRILTPDQFKYDKDFTKVLSPTDKMNMLESCLEATILEGSCGYSVPCFTGVMNTAIQEQFESTSPVFPFQDNNGYFIKNMNTGLRSKSVSSFNEISQDMIDYIRKGEL